MAMYESIFWLLALVWLCTAPTQGELLPPSFGDITYVTKESNVTLTWRLNFGKNPQLGDRSWFFTPFGRNETKLAAVLNGVLTKEKNVPLSFNIVLPTTLILNNVNMTYNGTYTFDVSVRDFKRVTPVDVEVIILDQPHARYSCYRRWQRGVYENENISCLCTGSGGNPPPSVVWLKNDKPITSKGFLQQTLTITNAANNDTGNYTCKATSHTLKDKPIIEPFTINSTSKYVVRGSSVLFTCNVHSYTPHRAKLYHNGSEISMIYSDINHGKYIIKAVNSTHNGNYQCVAENRVGKTSRNIELEVIERPRASINCTDIKDTFMEGDRISCTCVDENNLQIAKAWWISNDGTKNGHSLLVKTLTRKDHGKWTCHVEIDESLTDKIPILVMVQYKPEFSLFEVISEEVEVGSRVFFIWQVSAHPPATVKMFHNGSEMRGLRNEKYIINSVTFNQSGNYQCQADNGVAVVKSKIITLKITSGKDNNDSQIDWYIAVITFLCGLLIGAIVIYVVIKLRHRVTKQLEQQQSIVYDDVIPSEAQPSIYQELNLNDMNQPENYQALKRVVGGGGQSNNCLDVKDSNYQELNNPRGRSADNYQSLRKT